MYMQINSLWLRLAAQKSKCYSVDVVLDSTILLNECEICTADKQNQIIGCVRMMKV